MNAAIGEKQYIPSRGPLSVTVPGVVDGWFELHNRFGNLPMEKILEPSIRYSTEGVPVPQIIAHRWKNSITQVEESQGHITEIENFYSTFSIKGRAHHYADPDFYGGYQAIQWDRKYGVYHGASEMRKDGQAGGY